MLNIVIKPTIDCNLKCAYCNLEKRESKKLSLNKAKLFLELISSYYENEIISIRWHGGEPLLMGLEFFNDILNYQKKLHPIFLNTISTNLTLLNKEYIKLFKENGFHIITSIDGIGDSHDLQRNNTFKRVEKSLKMLNEVDYNNITVRSTISKYNENNFSEIYYYCCKFGYSWEFSVIIPSGIQKGNSLKILPNPMQFSNEVNNIFDIWINKENYIKVQVFNNFIDFLFNRTDYVKNSKPRLTLGPDGYIYDCPMLIGNNKNKVSNILNNEILYSFNKLSCSNNTLKYKKCYDCRFDYFCKLNHCKYLKIIGNNYSLVANYLCSCWEPIYNHIYERVFSTILNIK